MYRTCTINGMILWILFGAFAFAAIFIKTGAPDFVEQFILGFDAAPIVIILMMQVSFFIFGCLMDEVTILVITLPVYMPILVSFGYDPVWFGVLFVVNMQMAYLTPPFGYTIFYMRGVAPPEVTITDIYKSILPLLGLQWIGLLLVMFFPQLCLWLPNEVLGLK